MQSATLRIIIANPLATALLTVGVFASLFAGYLQPELSMPANNLSTVIDALSTVIAQLIFIPAARVIGFVARIL